MTTRTRKQPQVIYTIPYTQKVFGTLLIVIMALFCIVFFLSLIVRAFGHLFGL